ncbi:DUF2335 domain-containing protein [Tenacibaculum maritimum]|uniref:DUF2335 domain-containing protein n=1 Tax=Tenacibaculum maritimum TaxID=107401 RepID=UPI0012E4F1E9|nr:DUF2335 domain-containing protein [Tenacibaculum maritimum]MDB0602720.1 DUF2335 domain-containing protein [Tenacibaculum maritimum]MDB0612322.1 DUF2335 domain-containing protein [Tenacibaculum maritimum]CAA0144328.1 hypothetical protein TM902_140067 [Tenacibaculum maritimum]CAA0194075.1 hypothetical protein TFA04_210069 [Tenacibaculum maritimum]CAA0195850.1 hypothetical protein JIP32914_220017 [Tenacibaculum maritimum]
MNHNSEGTKLISKEGDSVEKVSVYQGPLPKIEDLEKYNQIIPNGAERFMKMAEDEREDRNILKNRELDYNFDLSKKDFRLKLISLIVSCIIAICFLSVCIYGFYLGYPTQSASIIAVLIGIIGYFTWQKTEKK